MPTKTATKTTRKPARKSNASKPDSTNKANEYLTEKFIEAIEKGVSPLQKLWSSSHGMPRGYDGHQYRGANFFLALFAMWEADWEIPVFITFKKAKEIGHPILKGSKGIKVFYSSMSVPKEYKDCPDQCPAEDRRFFTKMYSVFNVAQCEGIDLDQFRAEPKQAFQTIETAEAVLAGYAGAPSVTHCEPRAFYRPSTDTVNMPKKDAFHAETGYYSVLFHELAHSTGAQHRLDRDLSGDKFSNEYAFEELIAELSAAFLCAQTGISEKQFDNSAAYLASWLKAFKSDSSYLRKAMSHAQKAVDHINGTTF